MNFTINTFISNVFWKETLTQHLWKYRIHYRIRTKQIYRCKQNKTKTKHANWIFRSNKNRKITHEIDKNSYTNWMYTNKWTNDPVAHTDRIEMKCVARIEHANDSMFTQIQSHMRVYVQCLFTFNTRIHMKNSLL